MPKSAQDFDLRGGRIKEVNLPDQNAQRLEQTAHALTIKTGWSNTPAVTLSFVDGSRTFTITPDGSTFEYWIQGIKYTKSSAESVIIGVTEGLWYIYYVGTTLTASQTPWSIRAGDKCLVSFIHWDATNNKCIFCGYECHSHDMPPSTHSYLHHTIGANYEEGLALVHGTGGNDGQVALDSGEIHDEDIGINITDGAGSGLFEQELGNTSVFAPAQIPVFYRLGATAWRKYTATNFPFYDNAGGDNVYYNSYSVPNWASTEAATSAKYIAMWIFGTNNISEPVIAIMGQVESLTLNAAKEANTLEGISWGTLPFKEMKILYRLIFKSNSTWAHTEDMRQVANIAGGTYVPAPTPSLDAVCAVGSEYDGAVSEATAMKVGDGVDFLEIYTSGGETYINRISGNKLIYTSDGVLPNIEVRIDVDHRTFFGHSVDGYGRIYSTDEIRFQTSGVTADYLEFYTAGGECYIKRYGGQSLTLLADGTDTNFAVTSTTDDASIILTAADDSFLLLKKNADNKGVFYYDDSEESLLIRAYDAAGTIRLQPNGITVDYFQFSNVGGRNTLKGVGGALDLQADSYIYFRPNNDTSDYFRVGTISNIPHIKLIGGSAFQLQTDGGTIDVMPSNDFDDYIRFRTAGDQAYIESIGCLFNMNVPSTSEWYNFYFGGVQKYYLSNVRFTPVVLSMDLGANSATTWDVVYYHSLSDKTCASFVGYSDVELYNMLKMIQPRTDGLLHHDKNSKKESYFPHIDMVTIPDEFAVIADEDYTLEEIPIDIDGVKEKVGKIDFKKGDKCGINFNTMVYAMNELLILLYEKIRR